jgi:hypothetical protein
MIGLSRAIVPLLLVVVAWLSAAPAAGASRYDPALRFQTITTRHFHIHFHQEQGRLAQRLARIAEAVHADLALRLHTTPSGRTHVVLADQDDVANGFATTMPYNAVQIVTGPPGTSSLIGNTDDWLRLVFTHEYAHILDLDRAESLARALRLIFGRAPIAFPNAAQPLWQIEGLATYEETQITSRGRLAAGDFRSLLAEPRRANRLEPLDRAGGGLVQWPAGLAPYAYGAFFFRYLGERYGEASIAELSRTTARGYYFLPGLAFRRVFRRPLGEVWRQFEQALPVTLAEPGDGAPLPKRLTFGGFQKSAPRFLPAGMSVATPHGTVAAPALLYSDQNADEFPSLMIVPVDAALFRQRLATRFGGTSSTTDSRSIIFDQIDLSKSVAWRSDLYRLDVSSGRVTRLTQNARVLAPDVSADGTRLACIRLIAGVRTLAVFDLAAIDGARAHRLPDPVFSLQEPDTQYDSPRWSPDGRWLAAGRWKRGGLSELVIIDVATRRVAVVAASARGRNASPAWCPDGRTLIFSSDREGGEFALYAVEISTAAEPWGVPLATYRVARVAGGAMSPDVSPDGQLIAFVGSTTAGYDIFTLPGDQAGWERLAADASVTADATPTVPPVSNGESGAPAPASSYAPLGMLLPRYWLPEARSENGRLKAGFSTSSADVLGRHALNLDLTWRVTGRPAGEHIGGRPDWSASYLYDRWRPGFYVSGSETTWFQGVAVGSGPSSLQSIRWRDLTAEAGIRLSVQTVRHVQLWQAAFTLARSRLETPGAISMNRRNGVRLAWTCSNSKIYGYSIGPEQGVAVGVTTELARRELGADGNAGALTAEIRAYPRLAGRHAVLAVRVGAGTSSGHRSVRRIYYLGGSDPAGSLIDFGSGALSMMRGFSPLEFAGYHLWVANLEYRRPVLRLDRGLGWLPVFARVLHAAAFIDAGSAAWKRFLINDTKVSVGGEASVDLVVGYTLPVTLSTGAAWTRRGRSAPFEGPTFYFRVGRAF